MRTLRLPGIFRVVYFIQLSSACYGQSTQAQFRMLSQEDVKTNETVGEPFTGIFFHA